MMNELIYKFPQQLEEAVSIAENAKLSAPANAIHKVVICGLGGSGIGGTILKETIQEEVNVPVEIMKSYTLPGYVDKHTLVICCSYSGNTEETLESFSVAKKHNAHIVCITSGGKLHELAKANKCDAIVIPPGMPPRACLGYSLTQLFHIMESLGFVSGYMEKILSGAKLLVENQTSLMNAAKRMAEILIDRTPVIYSTSLHEGVAIRFRQQLNENAKILCWHHVIPEMNHNELVGWSHDYPEIAVLIFKDEHEHPRNELRIELCKKVFETYAQVVIEIKSKGASNLEKKLYWIHFGDWVSLYLSEERKVDAMEVKVIEQLKTDLSNK
ncbi:MAG TPA: bifunctional phosphoglucose/phosphomannose isomerase [Bacteroidia bacterium]|nr:bifunctional phosphoglucose/phosphomannose isomerase [Bacteroidia bacterium]